MKKMFLIAASLILAFAASAEEAVYDNYAEQLFMGGGYQSSTNVQPKASFASFSQLMQALPAMPTEEQVLSAENKHLVDSVTYAPFNLALQQMQTTLLYQQTELSGRIERARQKSLAQSQQAMAQYQKTVDAGLAPSPQEMMQAVMSSGIDLEHATEEQIMNAVADMFAKKWDISKEEYLKIVTLAQKNEKKAEEYIRVNHPVLYARLHGLNPQGVDNSQPDDPRNGRFQEIYEEVQQIAPEISALQESYANLQESLRDAINGRYHTDVTAILGGELKKMQETLYNDWMASEEYKQVNEIENALQKRVEQWTKTLSYDVFADVDYPAWWTAERKRENQLIDQWNRKHASQWLAVANEQQKKMKELFGRLAQLEAENEKLGSQGTDDNMLYLMNKQQILSNIGIAQHLLTPYQDALLFPCVQRVEEKGSIHMGKG